jgi:hypothetical protein
MSKSDTMYIAFSHGGRLPSSVTGEPKERKVPPHEAVRVPRAYGEHLVHDKFAYEAEAPKKKVDAGRGKRLQDIEAQIAQVRQAVEDAADAAEKERLERDLAALEQDLAVAKA